VGDRLLLGLAFTCKSKLEASGGTVLHLSRYASSCWIAVDNTILIYQTFQLVQFLNFGVAYSRRYQIQVIPSSISNGRSLKSNITANPLSQTHDINKDTRPSPNHPL
jgi:hypothetical protein